MNPPCHQYMRGLGHGHLGPRRFRKLRRGDAILGVTKPALRRLARRGGVKRIQVDIYDEMRKVIKQHLKTILSKLVLVIETAGASHSQGRKTITTEDVIFVLKNYIGTPLYGFEKVIVHSRRTGTSRVVKY